MGLGAEAIMLDEMRRSIRATLAILLLSAFFFMVLPYPAIDTAVTKCHNPCQSHADTYLEQGTQWLWFGGYHFIPEEVLPKEGWPALDNYYDLTYTSAGAVGFGIVSLALGAGTYVGAHRLLRRKKSLAHTRETHSQ